MDSFEIMALTDMPNKSYKIIFQIDKRISEKKKGIEKLLKYKYLPFESKEDTYIEVDVKDLFEEDRKRKNNVVGMTIVNVINNIKPLMEIFKRAYAPLTQNVDELVYNAIEKLIAKNDLNSIQPEYLHSLYMNILDTITKESDENIGKSNLEILNDLVKNKKVKLELNTPYTRVFNFLKDFYANNIINFIAYDETLALNVISKSLSKEKLMEVIYKNITYTVLDDIKYAITLQLGQKYSFLINSFVEQYIYIFKNIFSKQNTEIFLYYKRSILDTTKTNNQFHTLLKEYFTNYDNSSSGINFLKNMNNFFISSMLLDLSSIQHDIDNNNSNTNYSIKDITTSVKKLSEYIIEYTYDISCIRELFLVSMKHIEEDNRAVIKCQECGRYFVSNTKNSEVFCRRLDPYTKRETKNHCYEIGKQLNSVHYSDTYKKLYKNINDRLGNTKKYGEDAQAKFRKEFESVKEKLELKEHDKKLLEKPLIEWLKKYDENLKKKYK